MEAKSPAQQLRIMEDRRKLPRIEVMKDVVGDDDVELPALSDQLGAMCPTVADALHARRPGGKGEGSLIRVNRRHGEPEAIPPGPPR